MLLRQTLCIKPSGTERLEYIMVELLSHDAALHSGRCCNGHGCGGVQVMMSFIWIMMRGERRLAGVSARPSDVFYLSVCVVWCSVWSIEKHGCRFTLTQKHSTLHKTGTIYACLWMENLGVLVRKATEMSKEVSQSRICMLVDTQTELLLWSYRYKASANCLRCRSLEIRSIHQSKNNWPFINNMGGIIH